MRASILFLILFFSLLFTFPGSLTAKGEALETRLVKVEGEIHSSLARAIRAAGEKSSLTNAIKVGVRVKQKQVIGYVGSTGFSTGPHLDFRITRDGKFLDPLKKENFPSGQPIGKNDKEPFQKRREEVMAWLKDGPCLE